MLVSRLSTSPPRRKPYTDSPPQGPRVCSLKHTQNSATHSAAWPRKGRHVGAGREAQAGCVQAAIGPESSAFCVFARVHCGCYSLSTCPSPAEWLLFAGQYAPSRECQVNQSRYTPVLMALRQSLVGARRPHCISTQGVKTWQLCQMSHTERERPSAMREQCGNLMESGRSGETSLKAQFWSRDLQE